MKTIHMCHCVSTSKHIGEKLQPHKNNCARYIWVIKVDMGNVNSANSKI